MSEELDQFKHLRISEVVYVLQYNPDADGMIELLETYAEAFPQLIRNLTFTKNGILKLYPTPSGWLEIQTYDYIVVDSQGIRVIKHDLFNDTIFIKKTFDEKI